MRKRNIYKWMFYVNKPIPKQFLEFQFFCSLFWKKNGKKRVFCDFLKKVDFW